MIGQTAYVPRPFLCVLFDVSHPKRTRLTNLPVDSCQVVENCIKGLQVLNKPFKYAVTCILMQKVGAGMVTTATFYWDTMKDGYCKIPWENDTLHAIVTVYAMGIEPYEEQMAPSY